MGIRNQFYALTLSVSLVLAGMQYAHADVTAVYKMSSKNGAGTQTLMYADKQHVRLNVPSGANKRTSMMKLGDKIYLIQGKVVQDLEQVASMMAMMGKSAKKTHSERSSIKYEDTGRTETIAGIKGRVYKFTEKGKKHEVVLGQDKDLEAAVLGMLEIGKALSVVMPRDSENLMKQNSPIKGMAMLRLDNRVQLQSINRSSIRDSAFELPSKPQQLGAGMGKLFAR